jgi:TRAP-type mannitol/chloroaromatic compound transport system permease small subunit
MELMIMSVSHHAENVPPVPHNILTIMSDGLSNVVHFFAVIFCWSYVLLIFAILINVIMRYGFSHGLIVFEEIQWHFYAVGMMFGLSYAEITNSQVRVDVVADKLKRRNAIRWEIVGAVFFILPFIFVVIYNGIPYVESAFAINESSNSPLGLPYRWVIKAVIPLSFALLAIAVTSRLLRNINILIYGREK